MSAIPSTIDVNGPGVETVPTTPNTQAPDANPTPPAPPAPPTPTIAHPGQAAYEAAGQAATESIRNQAGLNPPPPAPAAPFRPQFNPKTDREFERRYYDIEPHALQTFES